VEIGASAGNYETLPEWVVKPQELSHC